MEGGEGLLGVGEVEVEVGWGEFGVVGVDGGVVIVGRGVVGLVGL